MGIIKKKTKVNKEKSLQEQEEQNEIQEAKSEGEELTEEQIKEHQSLISSLCHQGETCYQFLLKLAAMNQHLEKISNHLKEIVKQGKVRNNLLKENSDEEGDEEDEDTG